VQLPELACKALAAHRARQVAAGIVALPDAYVFTARNGKELEPRNVNRSFDRLLKRHGLKHVLLIANGVHPRVVMEMHRHADLAVPQHLRPRAADAYARCRRRPRCTTRALTMTGKKPKPLRPLPTTEQARDGGIVAAMNARYLLDAAIVLAGQDYPGPAVSLAVLALEEAVKGRALLGRVAVARTPGARYGFTDDQLRRLIYGPGHGLRHAAGLFQHMTPATLTALATGATPHSAEDKSAVEADLEAAEWLQRASKLKEGGIYVEFHDDHWHHPREMKKNEWDEALAVVEPFVNEAVRQAMGNLANKQAGKL